MLEYVIFITFIMILCFFSKKDCIFRITYILLILFSALRFDVGYDYSSYYNLASGQAPKYSVERIEILYRKLIELSIYLKKPQILFIITSFLTLFLIYKSLFHYEKRGLATFFYVGLFYLTTLTAQRYMLAYSVVLYSYKYIKSKEFFKYLFGVMIATLIHKMAIIGIFFYFIKEISFNIKKIIILITIIFLSRNFFAKLISYTSYQKYLTSSTSVGTKLIIIYFILGISLFFLRNKLEKLNIENRGLVNNYILGMTMNYLFFDYASAGLRLGFLGYIFFIYLVSDFIKIFTEKSGIFISCIIYLFSLALFLITVYFGDRNPNKKIYTPYKIFINKSIDDFKASEK